MKRCFGCLLAVLLAAGLLLGGLSGCESGSGAISDAKVDLKQTDQLVLYFPDYNAYAKDFSHKYNMAVLKFREMYPDVNVTVKKIGGSVDQYQTALNTDLMAGFGPDVILTNYFTNDLYKVMDAGAFLNLNSVISGDSSFNMNDYNTAVMAAGYYKGGQYIMPTTYTLPILLADKNGLNSVGFDLSKATDATAFLNEVGQCLPKFQENPAFGLIIDDTDSYYRHGTGNTFNNMGTALLYASGIKLIDETTKEALPDEASFKAFCEAYKPFWENDMSSAAANMRYYEALSSGAMLFQAHFRFTDFPEWSVLNDNGTPVWTALRTHDGGLAATVYNGAAINASSPNQLNAWNYIKILLSEPIQVVVPGDRGLGAFPVNKAALGKEIAIDSVSEGNWGFNDASGHYSYSFLAIPAEEIAPYAALHAEITSCSLKNPKLYNFFDICMTPYFKGDKSLDDCIAAIKNRLTLYASE